MDPIEFPKDFSEFLTLLNVHEVEYLLIGGVNYEECASRSNVHL